MSNKTQSDRHPIRSLLKLLVFAGLIALVARTLAEKKKEFYGLTESQARQKFTEKLGAKIGEERATEVVDQIIPKLKERGVVVDDPASDDTPDTGVDGSDADSDE